MNKSKNYYILWFFLILIASCRTSLFSPIDQKGKKDAERVEDLLKQNPDEAIREAEKILQNNPYNNLVRELLIEALMKKHNLMPSRRAAAAVMQGKALSKDLLWEQFIGFSETEERMRILRGSEASLRDLIAKRSDTKRVKGLFAEVLLQKSLFDIRENTFFQNKYDRDLADRKLEEATASKILANFNDSKRYYLSANKIETASYLGKLIDDIEGDDDGLEAKEKLINFLNKKDLGPSSVKIASCIQKDGACVLVLGDSISAGLFSDTLLSEEATPDQKLTEFSLSHISELRNVDFFERLKVFDSYYKENSQSSYTSKLARKLGTSLQNQARSAHKVGDLNGQLRGLLASLKTDQNYIIVEIGSNDLCGLEGNETQRFIDDYRNVVEGIRRDFPQAKIFLLPIFNVASLREVTKVNILSPMIFNIFTSNNIENSCKSIQEAMCPLLTTRPLADITDLRTQMNRGIETIAGAQERVFYLDSLESLQITESDLDMDCFHPNKAAHQKIAEAVAKFIEERSLNF